MAVGKAGEPADRDRLAIRFGDVWVAKDGLPVDGYDETPVAAHLKGQDVRIGADLRLGEGRATVWTCDLTHRSEEHTSELQSLMRISYAVFCLKKKKHTRIKQQNTTTKTKRDATT